MANYSLVKSVSKALTLLEILNRQNLTTIDVLHQVSGLPKPTIVRFMKTLEQAGYVTRAEAGKGYSVTSAVTMLSSGYQGAPMVVEAARPWIQDLTRMTKWPIAIATLDGTAMVVSTTTSAESPMSPYQGILQRRMGLLSRAMGVAYLACCPLDERELILEFMSRTPHPDSHLDLTRPEIDTLLDSTRARGYALRTVGYNNSPSSSLALPIYDSDRKRVLASMTLTWYRSAFNPQEALGRYLERMRSVSASITASVAALQRGSTSLEE